MSAARVAWAPARGARNYSVQATTDRGLTDTCNTTGGSCFLRGLQCGQIYNVSVKAHNMACDDGVTSEPHPLMTGTVARLETSRRLHVYNHSDYMFVHVCIVAVPIQSPAHPPGSQPVWIASSSAPQFRGSRATWPSVTWPTLRAPAATAVIVPAQEQRPSVK